MAWKEIPISVDEVAFSFKIELDSRPFRLQFTWNERLAAWKMNIQDDTGLDLICGIAIYPLNKLLKSYKYNTALPQGDLMAINLVDGVTPPTIDNLGTDVVLFYNEAV